MRGFFALLCSLLLTSLLVCADDYSDENDGSNNAISLQNCVNPTVEVVNVTILCSNSYRYSYGNNMHQNSEVCDYGDTAQITVFFSVSQDLDNNDHIYMDMTVFAAKMSTYRQVFEVRKADLCQTYVGHQCTTAGGYAFAFPANLEVYDGQDASSFVPVVSFRFSTQRDDKYNLGGANINCNYTADNVQYAPTHTGAAKAQQSKTSFGAGSFDPSYGLQLGGVMLLVAFAGFAWWKLGPQMESQGDSFNLMDDATPRSVV
jgi:hypothetical protein